MTVYQFLAGSTGMGPMGWELLCFAGLGAAITVGCMLPNRWLPALPNDKLMHFVAFALLSAMALRLAHGWRAEVLWLGGLLVAGWLIECLQGALVHDRHFCWRDIGANAAGIGVVAACAAMYDVVA